MFRRFFSRPKWQHRDPVVRLEGVRELSEGDPLLMELARTDEDVGVRRQAVRRLVDPVVLIECSGRDADESVRDGARRRLCRLVTGEDPSPLNPNQRELAARHLTDAESLTRLLVHADLVSLRLDALSRIDRQSLMAEAALNDASAEVRLAAVERLDQPSTLERVARQAKGKDKRVARVARDKLDALRIEAERPVRQREVADGLDQLVAQGTPDLVRYRHLTDQWQQFAEGADAALAARVARAKADFETQYQAHQAALASHDRQRELCERAESLVTDLAAPAADPPLPLPPVAEALRMLETAWADLATEGPEINSGFAARFNDAVKESRLRLAQLESQMAVRAEFSAVAERMTRLAEATAVPDPRDIKRLADRWQDLSTRHPRMDLQALADHYRYVLERARTRVEEAKAQESGLTAELDQLERELETALADGELQLAISLRDKVRDRLNRLVDINSARAAPRDKRLRRLAGRLDELRDWRRYGLLQVRSDLVTRMESLIGADQSPAKLAQEIHGLQEEWRSLDRANGFAPEGLRQAFGAAEERAYAPCQAHFAALAEERQAHVESRSALCSALEALLETTDWSDPDWFSLDQRMRKVRGEWRDLGGVDPADWRTLNGRFQTILERFEERLGPERERELRRREALVSAVEALTQETDVHKAVSAVKAAQAEWQPRISAPRKVEQALWRRFRAACDDVFKRLDEQRSVQRQVDADRVAAREALCETAERLADDAPPQERPWSRLAELRTAWREAEPAPVRQRGVLERRFTAACERIELAERRTMAAAAAEQEALWDERATLCERMEAMLDTGGDAAVLSAIDERWSELPPVADHHIGRVLEERYGRARRLLSEPEVVVEATEAESNQAEAERLCLEMEILASVDSPEPFVQDRLAMKVKRLSGAMMGADEAVDKVQEYRGILGRWFTIGPLPVAHRDKLRERFASARHAFHAADAPKSR